MGMNTVRPINQKMCHFGQKKHWKLPEEPSYYVSDPGEFNVWQTLELTGLVMYRILRCKLTSF